MPCSTQSGLPMLGCCGEPPVLEVEFITGLAVYRTVSSGFLVPTVAQQNQLLADLYALILADAYPAPQGANNSTSVTRNIGGTLSSWNPIIIDWNAPGDVACNAGTSDLAEPGAGWITTATATIYAFKKIQVYAPQTRGWCIGEREPAGALRVNAACGYVNNSAPIISLTPVSGSNLQILPHEPPAFGTLQSGNGNVLNATYAADTSIPFPCPP